LTLWPGPPHPRCLPLLRSYSPTPPCQTPRLLDLRPRCFWHAVWSCLVRHSARSQRWRALPTTHRQPCTQLTTGQQTAPSSATRASACAGQPPLDPASCISSCQACATSRPTASVLTVRGRAPALTDPLVYQPDGPGNHQESSEPPPELTGWLVLAYTPSIASTLANPAPSRRSGRPRLLCSPTAPGISCRLSPPS
jgi:hypothetical protein